MKSLGFIVRKYSSIAFFDVYEIAQFDTSTITNIYLKKGLHYSKRIFFDTIFILMSYKIEI